LANEAIAAAGDRAEQRHRDDDAEQTAGQRDALVLDVEELGADDQEEGQGEHDGIPPPIGGKGGADTHAEADDRDRNEARTARAALPHPRLIGDLRENLRDANGAPRWSAPFPELRVHLGLTEARDHCFPPSPRMSVRPLRA
jgi:hypothetical protein